MKNLKTVTSPLRLSDTVLREVEAESKRTEGTKKKAFFGGEGRGGEKDGRKEKPLSVSKGNLGPQSNPLFYKTILNNNSPLMSSFPPGVSSDPLH